MCDDCGVQNVCHHLLIITSTFLGTVQLVQIAGSIATGHFANAKGPRATKVLADKKLWLF